MQQNHVDVLFVQRGLEGSRDPRGDLKSDRRELCLFTEVPLCASGLGNCLHS